MIEQHEETRRHCQWIAEFTNHSTTNSLLISQTVLRAHTIFCYYFTYMLGRSGREKHGYDKYDSTDLHYRSWSSEKRYGRPNPLIRRKKKPNCNRSCQRSTKYRQSQYVDTPRRGSLSNHLRSLTSGPYPKERRGREGKGETNNDRTTRGNVLYIASGLLNIQTTLPQTNL